jgi:hypothetical protein
MLSSGLFPGVCSLNTDVPEHCMSHLHRSMKMGHTECSEMLASTLQTPGNNPEESARHSKHGKSLK